MAPVACPVTIDYISDPLGKPSQQLRRSEIHGVPALTFTGILSQGLRIAPP